VGFRVKRKWATEIIIVVDQQNIGSFAGKKGRRAYADPSQNMQDRGNFARRLEAAQATELANHL